MKNIVVIHVLGGVVQAVYANDPNVDVKLFDEDNLESEGVNVAVAQQALDTFILDNNLAEVHIGGVETDHEHKRN